MRPKDGRSGGAGRHSRPRKLALVGVPLAVAIVIAIPALAAEPSTRPSAERAPAIPAKWVGTWRLVSERVVDQNGATVGSLFNDAVGKVTYTPRGDLWAIVGPRVPSAEVGALWYTATAEVDRKAQVVTHDVQYASIPSWIGGEQVRGYEFSARDKRLTLTTELGPELTGVLEWRRAGARWAGPL